MKSKGWLYSNVLLRSAEGDFLWDPCSLIDHDLIERWVQVEKCPFKTRSCGHGSKPKPKRAT